MRAESEGKTGSPNQIRRSTKNSAGGIAKPTDGRGTALSQAYLLLYYSRNALLSCSLYHNGDLDYIFLYVLV